MSTRKSLIGWRDVLSISPYPSRLTPCLSPINVVHNVIIVTPPPTPPSVLAYSNLLRLRGNEQRQEFLSEGKIAVDCKGLCMVQGFEENETMQGWGVACNQKSLHFSFSGDSIINCSDIETIVDLVTILQIVIEHSMAIGYLYEHMYI